MKHATYHDEVVGVLRAIGDPAFGARVRVDRGSQLEHLGIRFPALRQAVKRGFSFTRRPDGEVLDVWDDLWRESPYGDVLFAALEYYLPIVRKRISPALWPVVRHWADRVDNWCHADLLANVYSHILAAQPDDVYPQLERWNDSDNQWLRRISIVSLIHYSGKNAVFMAPERVLPLISNCLADHRNYVQKAVGWVLREMGHRYPDEIRAYLVEHGDALSTTAFTRSIERLGPADRSELRRLRAGSSPVVQRKSPA